MKLAAAGVVLAAGGSGTAAAQDVRVEVTPPRVIVRDIQRAVHAAIDEGIVREIARAVQIAGEGLAWRLHPQVRTGQRERAQFPVERERRETRSVRLGAEGWLELSNLTGDITITAGSGSTAQIEITRVSRGRTEADADRGLEEVQVEIAERGGTRATIETRHPAHRNPPYRVSVGYVITAPRGTRVTVKNVGGQVTTKGIRGDQDLDIVSGNIHVSDAGRISSAKTIAGTVTIVGADTDSLIEVGSASGAVILQNIRARRLHATAVAGNVEAQGITCSEAELSSMTGEVTFEGPLAARGRYSIQSYSGSIRFVPTGRVGFDLRAETFAGSISVDPPSAIPVSASRRSIRDTVGDGGAAVTLQTFSGRIVVVRR